MQAFVKFFAGVAGVLAATTGAVFANVDPNAVPEPGSVALAALGVAGVLFFARRGK